MWADTLPEGVNRLRIHWTSCTEPGNTGNLKTITPPEVFRIYWVGQWVLWRGGLNLFDLLKCYKMKHFFKMYFGLLPSLLWNWKSEMREKEKIWKLDCCAKDSLCTWSATLQTDLSQRVSWLRHSIQTHSDSLQPLPNYCIKKFAHHWDIMHYATTWFRQNVSFNEVPRFKSDLKCNIW